MLGHLFLLDPTGAGDRINRSMPFQRPRRAPSAHMRCIVPRRLVFVASAIIWRSPGTAEASDIP